MYNSSYVLKILFVVLVAPLLLISCAEKEEVPRQAAVRPIKLITIEQADLRNTSSFPAVINASQQAELSFQVGGQIKEINFNQAQEIKQDAVIAKLDQRNFTNDVSQARAAFQNADDEYQRAVTLMKQNAIAKSVLEQRESQRNITKAQLDSAEKALSDTVLIAPFSGVVASLPIEVLQNVNPGEIVAIVIDTTELEATANLPAGFIAEVENRSDRRAIVILDESSNSPIAAEFKEASLLADSSSQTYAVTFAFPPPDNLLILPGMNATLELSFSNPGDTQSRVSVPLASILSDGSDQFVWVVDNEQMTVTKRKVTLEPGIGQTAIVTEGLVSGETIAGAGAAYLSEGLQIRPWTN